jgi:vacuolar-type H+-ATPase subunit H
MNMRETKSAKGGANASAVERVLAAERGVERDLADAREEAAQLLAAARARGNRIRQRGEERVSRLYVAMEARIMAETERLRRESLAAGDAPAHDLHAGIGRDALKRAVERLAARMTGEDHGASQ